MKKLKHWTKQLEDVLASHDGIFGHNTEVNIRRYLHKIDVMCFGSSIIEILDEYTVRITLPSKYREDVLLHVLTTTPMPTECRYSKKKDQLTIEWHY
jgi:hypothetical protein